MSELGFNVPPTTWSYGDRTSVKVSSERPEKRGIDLNCDSWIGSLACYLLYYGRSGSLEPTTTGSMLFVNSNNFIFDPEALIVVTFLQRA